jgi:hypothetical protein
MQKYIKKYIMLSQDDKEDEKKKVVSNADKSTQTEKMGINNPDPTLLEEIIQQTREKLLQEQNENSLQNLNLNQNNINQIDEEQKTNQNQPQVEIQNNIKQEKTFDINTLNETVKMLMDETYMDELIINLNNGLETFVKGNAQSTYFFILYTLPFSTPEYHTGLIEAIVAEGGSKHQLIPFFRSLHFDLMNQENWEQMKIREPYRHMFEGKLMNPLSPEDEIPAMKAMQTRLRQAYQTHIMEMDEGLKYLKERPEWHQEEMKQKMTSQDYTAEFLKKQIVNKNNADSQQQNQI